jgi:hypothetical protein
MTAEYLLLGVFVGFVASVPVVMWLALRRR